jgi:hypothetical protein
MLNRYAGTVAALTTNLTIHVPITNIGRLSEVGGLDDWIMLVEITYVGTLA